MKRFAIIASIVILVVIAGMFYIRNTDVDTQVTKNKTKVGCVFIGSKSDKSWGQSHYEAMLSCADDLNLEIVCKENVPGDSTCLDVIDELIKSGCKIIMCDSYSHGEWITKAAQKHSNVYFFHATGVAEGHNITSYMGRMYQMRYLSGIVAGLQTQTNAIGYVAAFPIDEVNRGINAFTLGVKSVNPDANVYVNWAESWNGSAECRKATEDLLDAYDIDVLAMHSDSLEPLNVAKERGVWSIGYNMDNSEAYPDTYLTAPIWRWEKFYEPRILECLQGKFRGEHYWLDLNDGIVDLAPLTKNVSKGTAKVVEEEAKRLKSGAYDVFYGPINDNEGNIRVNVNESMSDLSMLNDFDWYVEGVEFYGDET